MGDTRRSFKCLVQIWRRTIEEEVFKLAAGAGLVFESSDNVNQEEMDKDFEQKIVPTTSRVSSPRAAKLLRPSINTTGTSSPLNKVQGPLFFATSKMTESKGAVSREPPIAGTLQHSKSAKTLRIETPTGVRKMVAPCEFVVPKKVTPQMSERSTVPKRSPFNASICKSTVKKGHISDEKTCQKPETARAVAAPRTKISKPKQECLITTRSVDAKALPFDLQTVGIGTKLNLKTNLYKNGHFGQLTSVADHRPNFRNSGEKSFATNSLEKVDLSSCRIPVLAARKNGAINRPLAAGLSFGTNTASRVSPVTPKETPKFELDHSKSVSQKGADNIIMKELAMSTPPYPVKHLVKGSDKFISPITKTSGKDCLGIALAQALKSPNRKNVVQPVEAVKMISKALEDICNPLTKTIGKDGTKATSGGNDNDACYDMPSTSRATTRQVQFNLQTMSLQTPAFEKRVTTVSPGKASLGKILYYNQAFYNRPSTSKIVAQPKLQSNANKPSSEACSERVQNQDSNKKLMDYKNKNIEKPEGNTQPTFTSCLVHMSIATIKDKTIDVAAIQVADEDRCIHRPYQKVVPPPCSRLFALERSSTFIVSPRTAFLKPNQCEDFTSLMAASKSKPFQSRQEQQGGLLRAY